MQSTGQTSTQEASFTPMQGWVMTYATWCNSTQAADPAQCRLPGDPVPAKPASRGGDVGGVPGEAGGGGLSPAKSGSTRRSRGRGSLPREVGGVPGEAGGGGLSPAKSGEYPAKPGEGVSPQRPGGEVPLARVGSSSCDAGPLT